MSLTSPWSNLPPLGCWQIPRVVLLSGIFLRIQNEKNSSGPMKTGIVIVPSRFCCRAFALGISLPLIESEREGIFPVVHDFSEKRVVFRRYHGAKCIFGPQMLKPVRPNFDTCFAIHNPAPTPPLLDAWRRYSGITCIVAVPGTRPGIDTGAGTVGGAGAGWNAAFP